MLEVGGLFLNMKKKTFFNFRLRAQLAYKMNHIKIYKEWPNLKQGWSGNTGGRNSHWYLQVIPVLGNTHLCSKNGKYWEMWLFITFLFKVFIVFYVI